MVDYYSFSKSPCLLACFAWIYPVLSHSHSKSNHMSRQERGLCLREVTQLEFWGACRWRELCSPLGVSSSRQERQSQSPGSKTGGPRDSSHHQLRRRGRWHRDSAGKALRSNIRRRTSPKSQVSKHMPWRASWECSSSNSSELPWCQTIYHEWYAHGI